MEKTKLFSLSLVLGVFTMSLAVGYLAFAWTEPIALPPGENVPAPLNVSINAQSKEGALVIGSNIGPGTLNPGITTALVVPSANVGIGTTAPGARLDVFTTTVNSSGIMSRDDGGARIFMVPELNAGGFNPMSLAGDIGLIYWGSGGQNTGSLMIGQWSGSPRGIKIDSVGNVGIGTATPGERLDVSGNIRASGNIVPAITNTGQLGTSAMFWNQVNAGAYFYSSDMNLKTNIRPINNVLNKINNLSGVYFNWKNTGEQSIGIIAQEVEKTFPQAVTTDKETGLKSVDYAKLVAPLIEAFKEQQKEIEELKTEINDLKLRLK